MTKKNKKSISTSGAAASDVVGNNNEQWSDIHGLPPPPSPSLCREALQLAEKNGLDNVKEEFLRIEKVDEPPPCFPPPPFPTLSPLAEATESSSEGVQSCSDESVDPSKISSLDSHLLHFVNNKVISASSSMSKGLGDGGKGGDYFNHKIDQLAKLHDLYASVSSISAKSQSHLDERQQRNEVDQHPHETFLIGGSTFSLGALEHLNEDANQLAEAASTSDVNSLCSEPAKMPECFKNRSGLDLDLRSFQTAIQNGGDASLSISLSDLGFSTSQTSSAKEKANKRSDSPVLEGIDQELAKYAKLKDLKQAYRCETEAEEVEAAAAGRRMKKESQKTEGGVKQEEKEKKVPLTRAPPSSSSSASSSSVSPPFSASCRRRDHVPDGASNPDLNHKALPLPTAATTTLQQQQPRMLKNEAAAAVVPRRSPGTGQSSCGSDPEELEIISRRRTLNREQRNNGFATATRSNSAKKGVQRENSPRSAKTATVGKRASSNHRRFEEEEKPVWELRKDVVNNVVVVGGGSPKKEEKENSSPLKSTTSSIKIPKFSRLFKISKSPLKVGQGAGGGGDKNRHLLLHQTRSSAATTEATSKETRGSDSETTNKGRRRSSTPEDRPLKQHDKEAGGKKPTSSSSSPLSPKNAKGTSSSAVECSRRNQQINKDTWSKRQRKTATHSTSSALLPSPYSFPSAARSSSGRGVETSSNDSGLGNEAVSGVRMRGRGANSIQRRAKHCRSSGYESSVAESIESPTTAAASTTIVEEDAATDNNVVELTLSPLLNQEPLPILKYGTEHVRRLDAMGRLSAVRCLKLQQQRLKSEMSAAKARIGSDPKRWSYELHVEESVGGFKTDVESAVVEAFARETQILRKRIDACKSHVKMLTCFDVKGSTAGSTCCTTECESTPVLHEDETEIF